MSCSTNSVESTVRVSSPAGSVLPVSPVGSAVADSGAVLEQRVHRPGSEAALAVTGSAGLIGAGVGQPSAGEQDEQGPGGGRPLRVLAGPSVVILGCTATGKSSLALAVARLAGNVELLSADSMQVYRGMDIGTAKPTVSEQAEVPHHLIDLVGIEDNFSVGDFQRRAARASAEIAGRGGRTVVVGGTGLYLQAVVDGLALPGRFPDTRAEIEAQPDTAVLHRQLSERDPLAASRMEPSNRRRIVRALEVTLGSGRPFSSFGPGIAAFPPTAHRLIGLTMDRERLTARIAARITAQLEAGWLDEIRSLDASSVGHWSDTAGQALGYRELRAHLCGERTLGQAIDQTVIRTRQFARRQERWFRRDPRIRWLDADTVATNSTAVAATLLEDWPKS